MANTLLSPDERIGALDAQTLCYPDANGVIHQAPAPELAVPDALALLQLAERYGLAQLWVHPSWIGHHSLQDWPEQAFLRLAVMTGWRFLSPTWGVWMSAYHPRVYGTRSIVFTHKEDRAPWREAPHAHALLAAVLLYREALGYSYRRSPGATGLNLLRSLHTGPRATELDIPEGLPPPARNNTEVPWGQWLRPLTLDEPGRQYIHAYDRNGMYLAACSSLALGVGTPQHRSYARAPQLLGPGADGWPVGYWRVKREQADRHTDALWGVALPDTLKLHRTPDADGAVWVTTPTAQLLHELGVTCVVHESYHWLATARYLEPWYKRIRDARTALLAQIASDAADGQDRIAWIALEALKTTYTNALGWLDGSWQRVAYDEGHAGLLYRPDWRHAVVALAFANLYRALVKFARDDGVVPVACNFDCIYVASDEPDAEKAAPAHMRLGTALGEWKINRAAVRMDDVRDVLTGEGASARAFSRRLGELKADNMGAMAYAGE